MNWGIPLSVGFDSESISPFVVPKRQAIELLPYDAPLRHRAVHQRHEAGVVRRLNQMNHLVDHEVLETPARLLRKIGVEADSAGLWVAAAPPGLHPLHEEPLHAHTQQLLPSREQWRHGFFQLLAIPRFNHSLSLFLASSRQHSQEEAAVLDLD